MRVRTMVLLGALCAVCGASVTGSSINAYGIDCSVLAPLYCTVSVLFMLQFIARSMLTALLQFACSSVLHDECRFMVLRGRVQVDLGCKVDGDVCKADPNAKPVRKTLESKI
jgi:hypothetical protein